MKKDYVMQSVQKRRYKSKPSHGWVSYVMVFILGIGIGAYGVFHMATSGVMKPLVLAKDKVVKPAIQNQNSQEQYDFYTLLKQRDEAVNEEVADNIPGNSYVLQVGVFEQATACKQLASTLKNEGFSVVEYHDPMHVDVCRIYVGPYEKLANAYDGQRHLLYKGHRSLLRKWAS